MIDIVENIPYVQESGRDISQKLSNFYEEMPEAPVSLRCATLRAPVDYMIACLKLNGIDAAYSLDERAADPGVTIVSENGIITPFVEAKEAKELATKIAQIAEANDIDISGFIFPITQDQLLAPRENNGYSELNLIGTHPDPQQYNDIINTYGKNFIQDMIAEAAQSSSEDHINMTQLAKTDRDKLICEVDSLWRGGTLGDNPYGVVTSALTKECVYATPYLSVAGGYAHPYQGTEGLHSFIYEFEVNPNQKYTCDFGIERLDAGSEEINYETPVFPHKNKLKNIYLQCQNENGEMIAYRAPLEDERWQDFLKLHLASDNHLQGVALERRKQDKALTSYKHYDFKTNDVHAIKDMNSYEMLTNIYGKDKVYKDDDGKTFVNCDVSLGNLKKFPNDFHDVKINGSLTVNSSIKFEEIPETTTGLKGDFDVVIDNSSQSKISAKELIKKFNGTQGLVADEFGYYPNFNNNSNLEKFPEDMKDYRFRNFANFKDTVFETLDDIPQTQQKAFGVKISDATDNKIFQLGKKEFAANFGIEEGEKWSYRKGRMDLSELSVFDAEKINQSSLNDISIKELKLPENTPLNYELKTFIKEVGVEKLDLSQVMPMDDFLLRLDAVSDIKSLTVSQKAENVLCSINMPNLEELAVPPHSLGVTMTSVDCPKLQNIDLTNCEKVVLENSSFPNAEQIKFPEGKEINISGSIFGKASIDLSKCGRVSLRDADFSKAESLILPETEEINLSGVKFPEGMKLDLSKYKKVTFSKDTDLSKLSGLKLPENGVVDNSCYEKIALPKCTEPIRLSTLSKLNSHNGIENLDKFEIIDDAKKVKNKELKNMGLSSELRSKIVTNRRKEKVLTVVNKVKDIVNPKNKVVHFINQLRGINKPSSSTVQEDIEKTATYSTETAKTAVSAETQKENAQTIQQHRGFPSENKQMQGPKKITENSNMATLIATHNAQQSKE